ncbi:hypothetical protein [Demequina capsici]|uniref:Uncharacterized protein n=1 Tax=Demequina capsici TaxID=3075620 RepID=A0AA96FCB8_9MICO|nr:hypothetical protein [Demequina sp. OYTSA14]WNM25700.1 hypothetical protein RN606_05990 [Demequina sp. OYTSA14]
MTEDELRPVCPVHPYGYHHAARVQPVGSRHVLRHHSLIGLPRRCPMLEEELLEADREIDMQDDLAVMQRTAAPARAVLVAVGVLVALVLLYTVPSAAVAIPVGTVTALALERIGSAVTRERMARVADWRRRVGR